MDGDGRDARPAHSCDCADRVRAGSPSEGADAAARRNREGSNARRADARAADPHSRGIALQRGDGGDRRVAFLMALPEFGFDVTPFEAAAAVGSLAFGFGAQNLVKDLINGFFIVLEDQFVVGDIIQANGETGRVEYLTLRRTVLRNVAGAMVTIPNGLLQQVANMSRDWSQAFVDVTVPSDEMVGRALATLEKISGDFRNDADWSGALVDGPRVLGVESLSTDGTVLRLQVRTVLNRKDDVSRELRRRIKLGFEQARIAMSQTHQVEFRGQVSSAEPESEPVAPHSNH